jgi:signal transduction histidine kinase
MVTGDRGAQKTRSRLRRTGVAFATAAAAAAAFGLWQWFSSPGRPADIGAGYVPMAPTCGLAMLAIAAAAIARLLFSDRRRVRLAADVTCLVVIVFAAIVLVARITDTITFFERALAPSASEHAKVPSGLMSPITAGLFMLCGVFLLLVRSDLSATRWRRWATTTMAVTLTAAGVVIVTGYAYGTPFLYGFDFIPVAPISGLAFLFCGLTFWTLLPRDRWPVSTLVQPSVRGRLLWIFVPLVLAFELAGGAIQYRDLPRFANPAAGALLLALAMGVPAGLVVQVLARRIGGSADDLVFGHRETARDALELADELERRVSERTAELVAANRELEAFAYSISHDLRGPLRSIDGFGQILTEDYADALDDAGRDNLRRIRAGAQRMGQLIDDLLSLSRVSHSEVRIVEVDLSRLATGIFARLHEHDPQRLVDAVVAPGCTAQTDAGLATVLLKNLIGNAWKFTSTRAEAHIDFAEMRLGNERVFCLRDDGAGFEQAYADKLFQPFQQLHEPDEYLGTGIGLAIVQRIVARLGGRCWAEGAVGAGATFYFTLGAQAG